MTIARIQLTDLFGGICNGSHVERLTVEDADRFTNDELLKKAQEEFNQLGAIYCLEYECGTSLQYNRADQLAAITIDFE
jgi:hypothetical protein